MNYIEWNTVIKDHFFNEQMAGKEVVLYVDNKLIETLGAGTGDGIANFIESIKNGPPGVTRSSLCQKAFQAYAKWREKGIDSPQYVAYLAFFVLAAGVEADFAPHAYYPRLWNLLGVPNYGTPPSFDRMIHLWDDLEKWSREDKHESLGRFVARIRGNWWKVGLPLAQTIISSEERKRLPSLFTGASLDPTDPPTSEVMLGILKRYGYVFLEKRTCRVMESDKEGDIVLRNGLIELVLDELKEWDGSSFVEEITEAKEKTRTSLNQSGLRICLRTDLLSGTVYSYLRFKAKNPFPDEGLFFQFDKNKTELICTEAYKGWSTPLKDSSDVGPKHFDASKLDWGGETVLVDSEHHWRAKLRASSIRLFRLHLDDLPDWVETQSLDRGIEFMVACRQQETEVISKWGNESCVNFVKREVKGLPAGWVLFSGKNASKSCPGIDVLSVSKTIRLLLRGGIKGAAGNIYFKFAVPDIVLENGCGSEKVFINGQPLKQSAESNQIWELPEDLPVGIPLKIEAEIGSKEYLRCVFKLIDFELAHSFDDKLFRDTRGEISNNGNGMQVSGAVVFNQAKEIPYPGVLPTYLANYIVFIGGKPGEIVEWPAESLPDDWHPVWAIVNRGRKKWKAYFTGKPEQVDQGPGLPIDEKAAKKKWKDALWLKRKVIDPPELGKLKLIWRKYLEVSKNV